MSELVYLNVGDVFENHRRIFTRGVSFSLENGRISPASSGDYHFHENIRNTRLKAFIEAVQLDKSNLKFAISTQAFSGIFQDPKPVKKCFSVFVSGSNADALNQFNIAYKSALERMPVKKRYVLVEYRLPAWPEGFFKFAGVLIIPEDEDFDKDLKVKFRTYVELYRKNAAMDALAQFTAREIDSFQVATYVE